jgi:hypothetical protein
LHTRKPSNIYILYKNNLLPMDRATKYLKIELYASEGLGFRGWGRGRK